ncbi:hypothetical protein ACFYVL_44285 [Streptomyces sp. NPDC004111]|uniref:hypothetical protein n=1 Tax=Streptomyces sp. NPDC004111 TaxID=3364690 RepID=UPI0036BC7574
MSGSKKGFGGGQIKRGPIAADVIGRHFTTVCNAAVRDRRLSRRARGLLVEILSHQEGFTISEASLVAAGPEGRDAIRTALRELEGYGYLHRTQPRDGGQFSAAVFEVTDMPEGLLIGAASPWDASEPPPEENPRSEPLTGNPSTAGESQNPRSGPLTEKPSTDEPSTANPPHKKTNSSCGAENSLSPQDSDASDATGEERERAAAPGEERGNSECPRGPHDADADADRVVAAYAGALGRPLLNGSRTRLLTQAAGLLAAGLPVAWVAARAAEMPTRGWTDLEQHCERSRVPIPAQTGAPPSAAGAVPAARSAVEECPACDAYGWLLDDDDDGPQVRCAHAGLTAGDAR